MASIPSGDPDVPAYRARSYQLEMFEASLKDNIIVAMGTGSGKTHIALLRIMHELENSNQKLIWFLAPTVALCLQQHNVIIQHIPAAKSRTLTGLDKVELWTEQSTWDAVLRDIHVVISTHAVLADAMGHGFVKMSQLGLIIYDEAHHCVRKHPANKIMKDFYHPAVAKYGSDAVPRIMGLTASAGSSPGDLLTIESNLDSICTTPHAHRHELLEHTHRPELMRIMFTPKAIDGRQPLNETRKALIQDWLTLDIEKDPYVKRLRKSSPHGKELQRVPLTGKTYCGEQLRRFVDRVDHIFTELGAWAANYFIWASIEQLKARVHDFSVMLDWDNEERDYLVEILSQLPVPDLDLYSTDPADFPTSAKLEALIEFLVNTDGTDFSGLIFAQQRATVAVLAHVLTVHPSTRDRFRTGSFVGMATSTNRKDVLGELLTAKMQRGTLDDFRNGRKNLIVATDVLEEGIDVSACSVVVCYNKPPNLKSFVQRRGRARRQRSTYAILLSTVDDSSYLHKWREAEHAMEEAYQDDLRRLEKLRALETMDEDVDRRFCIESTGALLTADNATQHLYHFCSTLPHQSYVDNRPEFSFERHESGLLKGKVTLPSSVHPTVRSAEGQTWWKTERAARREVAFQSYKALYEFGLLNDNLLPLTKSREFTHKELGLLPPIVEASEQYDPWVDWANPWASPWASSDMHQSRILVRQNDKDKAYMKFICSTLPPPLEPMTLYWDSDTTYTVTFEAAEPVPDMTAENVETMRDITALYLQASTSKPMNAERDFITLFGPDLPLAEMMPWLEKYCGHEAALQIFTRKRSLDPMGIIRDHSRYGEMFLFKRWVVTGMNGSTTLEIECDSYPKRRNLLQQQTLATTRSAAGNDEIIESPTKKRIISADHCTVDRLPATETIFGRFIAVIIDKLEAALVATKLCETILRDIGFSDMQHIITAITMPSAQALTNYQRYEFFGDTVLKFTVSYSLYYQHPNWHEGYLSQGRDAIVQNPRLARAALDSGLDAFIISKMFTPRKWSAPCISDKLAPHTPNQRPMSTKVLADVVEALIGAAYIDGGHSKATTCITRFLPELTILKPEIPMAQDPGRHPIQHKALEETIGYTFNNNLLLMEAFTHASCQYDNCTQSYQRLEFLGDAVLDMIIVDIILKHSREISQGDMTRIKHAVVNANLLAFLCMEFEWTTPSTTVTTVTTPTTKPAITTSNTQTTVHLWQCLRHSPTTPLLLNPRTGTLKRHSTLRSSILHNLQNTRTYPWEPLSSLNPDKFFSDIIESILGSVFVDSGGDFTPCLTFLRRLGLIQYVERILDEGIDVVHPMQRAQVLGRSEIRFSTVRKVPSQSQSQSQNQNQDDKEDEEDEGEEGQEGATYDCTVSMGSLSLGLDDVVVTGCLSKEEAEVKAANAVVRILIEVGRGGEKED